MPYLRIEQLQIQTSDLCSVSIWAGAGGACNVAIMASIWVSPFALGRGGPGPVGEIGAGWLEEVDVSRVIVTPEARTPVANRPGRRTGRTGLRLSGHVAGHVLPDEWRPFIATAEALYADGWVDQPGETTIIPACARPTPPASPRSSIRGWQPQDRQRLAHGSRRLSTVLLATEEEAHRRARTTRVNSARVAGRGSRLGHQARHGWLLF